MFDSIPASLAGALQKRGFTALTAVQQAVLDPELAGRDLRMSSQTGSGKTVAIGLVLAPELERVASAASGQAPASTGSARPDGGDPKSSPRPSSVPPAGFGARPHAVLLAPTRELAVQLARELTWLYQPLGVHVASVTGGTSMSGELRALRQNPLVIVGTPGRLLDHLERRSIDPSNVGAVVLDEADQMLDLGFRDDLEAILGKMPEERRTHLVSATLSRDVLALANRYQRDAVRVQGTSAGEANEDIAHVAHLVRPSEREAALINLLLLTPGERTLVFVRTRADASEIADRLIDAGFSARALSGELEQWERTKTLDAFRSGAVTTLVATDVAARGLDVPEVGRVIHADPPGDADVLTHRSGRTGRAGRKGTSIVLVPPPAREHVIRLYRRARIEPVWSPVPSAADVQKAADERLLADLTAPPEGEVDPRLRALAEQLLASMEPASLVAALLARAERSGPCEPQAVTPIAPPSPMPVRPARPAMPGLAFVPFRINWGERQGADARRILAMVCRRGDIKSDQVGAIRIGDTMSTFEVASPVAPDFARNVRKPDARDHRIRIDAVTPAGPPHGRPMPMRSAPDAPARRPRPSPAGFAPPRRQVRMVVSGDRRP